MADVKLYTRQHINSIHELYQQGMMTNKEVFVKLHMGDIADYFMERYRTFVALAEKRLPRPTGVEYPIWTSVSKRNCLKPEANSFVYCLSVPEEEVLYFDGLKWDYVLNYLYIPLDEADDKRHQAYLKQLGIQSEHFVLNGKYQGLFPALESQIKQSWDRMFIIDEWNDFNVQANLWYIKKEWIERILYLEDDIFEEVNQPIDFDERYQQFKVRGII